MSNKDNEVRYIKRYHAAEQLIDGEEEKIKLWLRTPVKALGNKTPMKAD